MERVFSLCFCIKRLYRMCSSYALNKAILWTVFSVMPLNTVIVQNVFSLTLFNKAIAGNVFFSYAFE
jgi:hypothetical protein